MSTKFTYAIAGGRIICNQCHATSKRSRQRCKAPAMKGKQVCKFHGGLSTGPRTEIGRQRCAEAKTVHGRETRRGRIEQSIAMHRLRAIEELGHALGIFNGSKTPGRKPQKN